MSYVCDHEGCDRGISTGHALHRVSPKGPGQQFAGLCAEHYVGTPDPVAQAIEDANHGRDASPRKDETNG
jgi:hypothetical protein